MEITKIDTRQGTLSNYRFSNGNTLPLTGVPFAMNYFTIQNSGDKASWFFDPQSRRFEGFRLTHQPSPWIGDFQHIQILPISLCSNDLINDLAGSFDPDKAIFAPNKLVIQDLRYQINSQLIPSTYGALLRSRYALNELSGVQFELSGDFELTVTEHDITGWISNFSECEDSKFKMYVAFHFSQPLIQTKTRLLTTDYHTSEFITRQKITGNNARLCVFFSGNENELHCATSFISIEQVEINLRRQMNYGFNQLALSASQSWQTYFDRITIEDVRHPDRVETFYTTLYRLFLFPQKFYELDSNNHPIHYDTSSHCIRSGVLYTNNGFWDTYKTVYPFYSILAPELLQEMLHGFLNSYYETGYLPKWLSPDERGMMPGTLIDAVIADAASKDLISKSLLSEFLTAMIKGATTQSLDTKYGRRGTLDYLKYGYVPNTHAESVNHTLDYAYSDYCIAVVAQKLGQDEVADKYLKSALNYQHLFDPDTGFIRAKDTLGHFQKNFSAIEWGNGYAEGGAWQNSFAVYQDIAGLAKLYGGFQYFFQKLVELVDTQPHFRVGSYGFEIHEMSEMVALNFGQLALSNQPSFHIPYLFVYVDHPEITELLVKQLLLKAFNSSITGFPGDEDNGSMAGWYILSALGFYPVTPGSSQYILGIPIFDSVTLHLPTKKKLVLNTFNNDDHNLFVQKRMLNGQNYNFSYITHQDLISGGVFSTTLALVPTSRQSPKQPFSISLMQHNHH